MNCLFYGSGGWISETIAVAAAASPRSSQLELPQGFFNLHLRSGVGHESEAVKVHGEFLIGIIKLVLLLKKA